jgi:hypothetical protein
MDKPQAGGRIRPLARRLDSLSGSPTSSTSRPSLRPRTAPKPVGSTSISSSSAVSVAGGVKDEDISVRDMLAQAKLRESKLETAPAPSIRGKKQVILTDVDFGKRMGSGASSLFLTDFGSSEEIQGSGVAIDSSETRCYPVKVPFEGSDHKIEDDSSAMLIDDELVLVQLPHLFPTLVPPVVESSPSHPTGRRRGPKAASAAPAVSSITGTPVSEIPDGRIGTLKVHKSGKVVLHVGSTTFDVTEGQNVNFRTEIACVCPAESEIIFLGDSGKRLIVTPTIS